MKLNSDNRGSIYVTNESDTRKKWDEFVNKFKSQRFFVSVKDGLLKLHIQSIINQNVVGLKAGETLYRARINEDDYKDFKNEELEAPPEHRTVNGRLNPKGIRYLYVADCPKTAIAEVRPWLSAIVTVAEVKLNNSVRIIDFVPKEYDMSNSYKKIIGDLFSRPVRPDSADFELLPTQCIAEFIKKQNFDGIKYASFLNPGGVNVCLFNPEIASVKISHKVKIDRIEFKSSNL